MKSKKKILVKFTWHQMAGRSSSAKREKKEKLNTLIPCENF